MNETLKRAISGAIYILLLLSSILFSTESFYLLFGVFLLISVYEFCDLIQIHKLFPIILASLLYAIVTLISSYKKETEYFLNKNFRINTSITININSLNTILLAITLIVSIKCIIFLFYDSIQKISDCLDKKSD